MQITILNRENIIKKCNQLIIGEGCNSVVTLNSLMLSNAWKNNELYSAIKRASLITADSIGVSVASFMLDGRKTRRYPGIEMMEDMISLGRKVFFLGGQKGVADRAVKNIKKRYPNARISGTYFGYFEKNKEKEIISRINYLRPDIIFVGMDLPHQEIWIDKNKNRIRAGLIIGVGGSFDVFSGELNRAPYIFQISGSEWLWRMLLQPWRFANIIGLTLFVFEILWRFLKNKSVFDEFDSMPTS